MAKKFIVRNAHPFSKYRLMVIEADSLERAVELAKRVTGVEASDAYELIDTYEDEVLGEDFVVIIDSQAGNSH